MSGPQEFLNEIVNGLTVTLTIGAAREDATPDQVEGLKSDVLPTLAAYKATGDIEPVLAAVYKVMGDGWKPGDAWQKQIDQVKGV